MSYLHIQQLASVRHELDAARVAIAYVERNKSKLNDEPEVRDVAVKHIRLALNNLEDTYIIRLFAEFEGILRDHLPPRAGHPDRRAIYDLINRVALRHRIPDPMRDAVQDVREYRNLLAHRGNAHARTIAFQSALSILNRYLDRLP